MQIAPKSSFEYVFNQATYLCEKGEADKAITLLEGYLPKLTQGDRRYSIVTSTLAYFYRKKQNLQKQEHFLLLSAISDVRGAILENSSLRELVAFLMQQGDYRKAYNYLLQASFDARNYGSRLRSVQVARLAPLVTKAYDLEREQTQRRTILLLAIISVIALLLIGTIVYILSLIKKRRKANEKISRMNEELSRQNGEIRSMNSQMKEANRIKDEYIGRFLELCSTLIHRGELRMKLLNRLARDRKLEELYDELKSSKAINEGIRTFHQNFDTAFLNIYPDFIEEVNRLMTADSQFEVSSERLRVLAEASEQVRAGEPRSGMAPRLTTELRVLALIRLGITDNQKIADILRSSITTIYTYRSKLKSRARIKETFEEDIKKIATY